MPPKNAKGKRKQMFSRVKGQLSQRPQNQRNIAKSEVLKVGKHMTAKERLQKEVSLKKAKGKRVEAVDDGDTEMMIMEQVVDGQLQTMETKVKLEGSVTVDEEEEVENVFINVSPNEVWIKEEPIDGIQFEDMVDEEEVADLEEGRARQLPANNVILVKLIPDDKSPTTSTGTTTKSAEKDLGPETTVKLAAKAPTPTPRQLFLQRQLQEQLQLQQQVQEQRKYVCKFCHIGFPDLLALYRHALTHAGDKPFICATCSRTFRTKADLWIHEQEHVSKVPFKCPYCPHSCSQEVYFKRHMQLHSKFGKLPVNTVVQKIVKKVLPTPSPNVASPSPPHLSCQTKGRSTRSPPSPRPFRCSTCSRRFRSKSALVSHSKVHLERKFWCIVCYSAFLTASALNKHQAIRHQGHLSSSPPHSGDASVELELDLNGEEDG